VFGDAEQDDSGYAELDQVRDFSAERVLRVLDDAGKRRDRLGLGDPFADKERSDQIVRREVGLGDQAPQGRSASQASESALGKGHGPSLRIHVLDQRIDQPIDGVGISLDVDNESKAPGPSRGDRADAGNDRGHMFDANQGAETIHG